MPAHVLSVGVAAHENAALASVGEPEQPDAAAATKRCEGEALQALRTRRAPAAVEPPSVSRHIVMALRGRSRPALSTAHFWLSPVAQAQSCTTVPAVVALL